MRFHASAMRGGFAPNLSNLCPTAARTEEEQTQMNRQAANSVIATTELSELIISMMSATEIADSVTQTRQERCVAAILLAGAVDRVNHATGVGAVDREDTWQRLMLGIFPDAPQNLQDFTGQESNIPAPTTYKEMFSQWCQRNKELIAAKARYEESVEDYRTKDFQSSESWRELDQFLLMDLGIDTLENYGLITNMSFEALKHFKKTHDEKTYSKFKKLDYKNRLDLYLSNEAKQLRYELEQKVMDASDRMKTWTDDSNGPALPKLRRQPAMIHMPDPRNDEHFTYP